jgi:hypothetical protein
MVKILSAALLSLCLVSSVIAESEPPTIDNFSVTWKHLSDEQRSQIVTGYLFGWRDAARITDIAIEYVKSNPAKAVEGLEKLKSLYDFSGLQPDVVVSRLNRFYEQPDNRGKPLSAALSSVKSER